jgi:histidine triad (HIT) family protein
MDDFSQNAKNAEIVGFVRALGEVAKIVGVSSYSEGKGYRYIGNNGPDGGQEVSHLHFHIIGGEPLGRMISK